MKPRLKPGRAESLHDELEGSWRLVSNAQLVVNVKVVEVCGNSHELAERQRFELARFQATQGDFADRSESLLSPEDSRGVRAGRPALQA
jgi:hypothetical protein